MTRYSCLCAMHFHLFTFSLYLANVFVTSAFKLPSLPSVQLLIIYLAKPINLIHITDYRN